MPEGRPSRRTLLRGAVPLAALAAAGTGCATDTIAGTPKFGLSTLPTSAAPTPTTTPTPEHVELTIAAVVTGTAGAHQKSLSSAVNGWVKSRPDATVRVEWIPSEQLRTKLAAMAAGGFAPDLVQYWPDAALIKSGLFTSVDDVLNPLKYDYLPAALATVAFKNSRYGIPIAEDASFFAYRKSVLNKAHLRAPESVAELRAAARTLTSGSRKGIALGITVSDVEIGGPLLWSAGLDYLTDDHQPGFTGARAERAVGAVMNMIADDSVYLGGAPGTVNGFLDGRVAIQWMRSALLPQVSGRFGNDLGILPFPRLDGHGSASVPIWTTSLLVNAKGKSVERATELARYLGGKDSSYLWDYNLSTDLSIPPRRSAAASGRRLQKGAAKRMLELVTQNAKADYRPDWTPPMYRAYTGALRNIFLHRAKASSALGTAAAAVRTELKKIYS